MEIRTSKKDDKSLTVAASLCFFCGKSSALYRCPRCECAYCGLKCYKSDRHMDCSETFYKESFISELKQREHVSEEEKGQIMEMIERTYDENPLFDGICREEDNEAATLAERLEGIDIDNLQEDDVDEVMKRLADEERKEFHKMIDTGEIFNIYHKQTGIQQEWQPFWYHHDNSLVTDIDCETEKMLVEKKDCKPAGIVGKNVSPNVIFNLINILYPYTLFQSVYNGTGHKDFPLDFSDSIICCSDFLSRNQVFNSVQEALIEALAKCRLCCKQGEIMITEHFLIECIRSTSHVLIGPNPSEPTKYIDKALTQLQKACTKARQLLKHPNLSGYDKEEVNTKKKCLFQVIKKMDFLLVWADENKDKLALLSIETLEIFKSRITEYESNQRLQKDVKRVVETNNKQNVSGEKQPKIVELN